MKYEIFKVSYPCITSYDKTEINSCFIYSTCRYIVVLALSIMMLFYPLLILLDAICPSGLEIKDTNHSSSSALHSDLCLNYDTNKMLHFEAV